MTAAWTAATLQRAKAIPKLDKFLGPDPNPRKRRRKPPPMDVQKARLMSWARANGAKAGTEADG